MRSTVHSPCKCVASFAGRLSLGAGRVIYSWGEGDEIFPKVFQKFCLRSFKGSFRHHPKTCPKVFQKSRLRSSKSSFRDHPKIFSLLACPSACLNHNPTCLRPCLPTSLPAGMPACLPICLPAHQPADVHAHLPTCLPICRPAWN